MRRYNKYSAVWRAIILVSHLHSYTASACLFLMQFYIHRENSFLYFFPRWRSDPIPGYCLPLRGFTITILGHFTSGRVISLKQGPLPDNTQHSKETTFIPPMGFEPIISKASDRRPPHLSSLGHWDRSFVCSTDYFIVPAINIQWLALIYLMLNF